MRTDTGKPLSSSGIATSSGATASGAACLMAAIEVLTFRPSQLLREAINEKA